MGWLFTCFIVQQPSAESPQTSTVPLYYRRAWQQKAAACNFFLPFGAPAQRVEPLEQPVWRPRTAHLSGNCAPASMTRGWKSELGFQEIGARLPARAWCPIWNARGWHRAWHLSVASPGAYQLGQIRVAGHTSSFADMAPAPAIPNPKSKLQNPNVILNFGFRILDLGSWILDFGLS